MALLEVKDISKQQPDRIIIDNISFQQEALRKLAVTGESGAGKSTLLNKLIPTANQATNERAGNAEHDGDDTAGRVATGDQEFRQRSGQQSQ